MKFNSYTFIQKPLIPHFWGGGWGWGTLLMVCQPSSYCLIFIVQLSILCVPILLEHVTDACLYVFTMKLIITHTLAHDRSITVGVTSTDGLSAVGAVKQAPFISITTDICNRERPHSFCKQVSKGKSTYINFMQ